MADVNQQHVVCRSGVQQESSWIEEETRVAG